MRNLLNANQVVLAVDPGMSGAVALAGRGALRVGRDFKSLRDIANGVQRMVEAVRPGFAIIELVGARPGQGVTSMFNFGKSTGTAYGAIHSVLPELFLEEVHPLKWQNFYKKKFQEQEWGTWEPQKIGPPKLKFDARKLASHVLPNHEALFKRKKDHNTADAVLIGLWKLAQLN